MLIFLAEFFRTFFAPAEKSMSPFKFISLGLLEGDFELQKKSCLKRKKWSFPRGNTWKSIPENTQFHSLSTALWATYFWYYLWPPKDNGQNRMYHSKYQVSHNQSSFGPSSQARPTTITSERYIFEAIDDEMWTSPVYDSPMPRPSTLNDIGTIVIKVIYLIHNTTLKIRQYDMYAKKISRPSIHSSSIVGKYRHHRKSSLVLGVDTSNDYRDDSPRRRWITSYRNYFHNWVEIC